jgi:uncharacterized membrane protein YdbT with pleckstrin-like domain
MDLQPDEEIVFEGRPVWRSTLAFYIKGFVGALVVAIVAAIAGVATALAIAIWLVLFALVVLVGLIRRLATRYSITNQRLRIERGILSKHVQQTRIERVQNVNTRQSFVERVLRVGTVDFDTAGTDDSDFTFVGVGSPHAVVEAVDRAQREAAAARRHGAATPPGPDGL